MRGGVCRRSLHSAGRGDVGDIKVLVSVPVAYGFIKRLLHLFSVCWIFFILERQARRWDSACLSIPFILSRDYVTFSEIRAIFLSFLPSWSAFCFSCSVSAC